MILSTRLVSRLENILKFFAAFSFCHRVKWVGQTYICYAKFPTHLQEGIVPRQQPLGLRGNRASQVAAGLWHWAFAVGEPEFSLERSSCVLGGPIKGYPYFKNSLILPRDSSPKSHHFSQMPRARHLDLSQPVAVDQELKQTAAWDPKDHVPSWEDGFTEKIEWVLVDISFNPKKIGKTDDFVHFSWSFFWVAKPPCSL